MARAKKTARADARRKYRAEQGLPPDPIDDETTDAPASTRSTTAAAPAGSAQRLSIGEAFRRSFTPLDVRGDVRALPWIATRTKALWVPALLTIVATVLIYVTRIAGTTAGEGTPAGQSSILDLVATFGYQYFVQTPAIGGVFIAGFLAPRASWLLGAIIGLLSAVCYAIIVLTAFTQATAGAPTPDAAREIVLYGFVLSPVLGAVFASAAAWYRRFLNLSNPNRGKGKSAAKVQGRPDGKSRSATSKAR